MMRGLIDNCEKTIVCPLSNSNRNRERRPMPERQVDVLQMPDQNAKMKTGVPIHDELRDS